MTRGLESIVLYTACRREVYMFSKNSFYHVKSAVSFVSKWEAYRVDGPMF